jgi:hypothetical protein
LFVMPGLRTLPAGLAEEDARRLRALEDRWMSAVEARGAERLLEPGTTALAAQHAYDTTYHLNDRGVALVTSLLEAALRPPPEQPAR